MTLYEMSEAARELYALLEAGEIDEQTVLDTMETIGAGEKLEAYIHVQKELEKEIAGFDTEIKRMTERKKTLESRVERLKAAQVQFMQATGQKFASAGTFRLTLRESKSVEITDEAAIPAEYITVIPSSTRPDKKAMLAALKNGAEISGASLKTGWSVIVK